MRLGFETMREKWFIYRRAEPSRHKESTFFRKCFTYYGTENVIANITADTRYLLYINGRYVCRGPESGDSFRKYYDELDITQYLCQGRNCIGVQVIHYPMGDDGIQRFAFGPTAFSGSLYGGLCVFSSGGGAQIGTDEGWNYLEDEGYEFREAQAAKYAGDMERVDFTRRPADWSCPEFDESGWKAAVLVQEAGENDGSMEYGILRNWVLHKRDLPMMEEEQIRPVSVYNRTQGISFDGLLKGEEIIVPPGTLAVCDIDMGSLVTAYVRSEYNAGPGRAEYLYSECYYREKEGALYKDQRDDCEKGVLSGESDELVLGEKPCVYEPFEYRAFRYMRLSIHAEATPVVLKNITFRRTCYPLSIKGSFRAQERTLERIWEVSLHTLRCCMQDVYMDCPYYERLQYVMDAMIEAVNTYPVSGDDSLARKALLDFASTQMPNGMIHCDAPSNDRHVIPGYAVYFIDMLSQHYWYFNDIGLVKKYWGVCVRLLDFFEERMDEQTGLVGDCGYWQFVDWTREWDGSRGVPRGEDKPSVHYIYSMMYAYGLMRMAQLTEAVYGADAAKQWKKRLNRMRERINKVILDKDSGYYCTFPGEKVYSQHAQVWAVLSGCVEDDGAGRLMERVSKDMSLVRCSYPMQYYYNRAMEKAGVARWEQSIWKEYKALLDKGLTTWPEDPVTARSDCHGWSAIPIYEICHVLLGIRPAEPGFGSIVIEPKMLELGSMSGEVWTPRGIVKAKRVVRQREVGVELEYSVCLPQEIQVTFRAAGRDLRSGVCRNMDIWVLLSEDGKHLIKAGR